MKKKLMVGTLIAFLGISSFVYSTNALTKNNNNTVENLLENKKSTTNLVIQDTINMRDFSYILSSSNEHYPISDAFIESYQQASGGYIDFAKQTGHMVNKANHEPNQKWHFFESWMFQSFQDNTLSWDEQAKSRVYTKLLCPELLLWIYEACGVDNTKVEAARDVAIEGKTNGTSTTTIAKNMRSVVSWDDLLTGLNAKNTANNYAFTYKDAGEVTTGITVNDLSNYLTNKNEHYSISNEYIKNYQQNSGGYIDFATSVGHQVDKDNYEPNQKWNFFQYYLFDSLKNGVINWQDDAKTAIYDNINTPELLLWLFEAIGVDSTKVTNAKDIAIQGKNNSEEVSITAQKMKEIVTWSTISNILVKPATSVSLSSTSLNLVIGEVEATISATVSPSDTTDIPTWSITEGSEYISISPNGKTVQVHAVKEGIAKVKVTFNSSVSQECIVTVGEPVPVIQGIPSEVNIDIDEELSLTPSLSKGEGTFSFTSSEDSIASVTSEGVVKGISYGSATIEIKCIEQPDITKIVNVTVAKKDPAGVESLYSTCLFGPTYNSKSTNRYVSSWSVTNDAFTWNIENFSNNSNKWEYVKTGSSASDSIGTITTANKYDVTISKVVLTIDAVTAKYVNSIKLMYGSSLSELTHSVTIDSVSKGDHEFKITEPMVNQYYQLYFDCAQSSSNGSLQISKIDFYKKVVSSNPQEDINSITSYMSLAYSFDVNYDFKLRVGVRKEIASIANKEEYGISVKVNDTETKYSQNKLKALSSEGLLYSTIELGDLSKDITKAKAEYTIKAYIVVSGVTYYTQLSNNIKSYSVVSMVKKYYLDDNVLLAKPLYEMFNELGCY